MVIHDCGHLTLFSERWVNIWIGKLLGAITGIDLDSFRNRHWEHHKIFCKEGDPQGFHYLNIKSKTKAAFLWHLFRPLIGYNLQYVISESILSLNNLIKSVKNGDIVLIIFVQILIMMGVTGFGQHIQLALLPMISAATFGLFFSQLRGIAEHGTRAVTSSGQLVRSHLGDILGQLFLYDVNFNYHKEHHDHPSIPSCNLPKKAKEETAKYSESMWQTLSMIYHRDK